MIEEGRKSRAVHMVGFMTHLDLQKKQDDVVLLQDAGRLRKQ